MSAASAAPDPSSLPLFHGNGPSVAQATIDWVHRHVKKAAWNGDRLRECFMQRDAAQILEDGDTLAVGPCTDRTAIAALVLRFNEVPFDVVVHERKVWGYGPTATIHMAIELTDVNPRCWFDFHAHDTRFLPGTYTYRSDLEETIQLRRFHGGDFDPFALTMKQVFEVISPRQLNHAERIEALCQDLETITPEMLEDRIVYDPSHSVYARNSFAAPAP